MAGDNAYLYAVIILAIIILTLIFFSESGYLERLVSNRDESLMPAPVTPPTDPNRSYIYLYEGFNSQNLALAFAPIIDYDKKAGNGYIRDILKINLKSVDINLPKINRHYDIIRRVEIWGVNEDRNIASDDSGFYNSYLEPESELRANPAKYTRLLQVLPGSSLKMDLVNPVKKIFLIAIL